MFIDMNIKEISMPLLHFIQSAICDHMRLHHGEYPKRVELHPIVFEEFYSQVRRISDYHHDNLYTLGTFMFMNVEICGDPLATKPKLINFRNEVEYL